MTRPVLLTGATGFLGMEVLARLLEQGDREVLALVRARDQAEADRRIDGVLGRLWHDPRPLRRRVRAVLGDVTQPGLGLARPLGRVGAVLHCAASISFSLDLAGARAINVAGTRRVLELARSLLPNNETLGNASEPLAYRPTVGVDHPVQVKATLIDLILDLLQLRLNRPHPRSPRSTARHERITLDLQQRRQHKRMRHLNARVERPLA